MMVGFAYQKGLIPLSEEAIARAIELNGAAVEMNKRAFLWGRFIARDAHAVDKLLSLPASQQEPFDLDRFVRARTKDLVAYQNPAYAKRYEQLVDKAKAAERRVPGTCGELTEAVARSYYKVLAYKDEYEVARLHTDGSFRRRLAETFEGDGKFTYHMAPPVLSRRDAKTGRRIKLAFGGWWMTPALHVLKHGKALRGTVIDPFARQSDRKVERALIREFEDDVELALSNLSPHNHRAAVELASLPMSVRGFGPIKEANYKAVQPLRHKYRNALLDSLCRA